MPRVLRLREYYRNLGSICLPLYVGMGVVSVAAGVLSDAPPAERFAMAAFSVLLWGGMSMLSLWILLAYWRYSVIVTEEGIVERGVVRRKYVALADITQAKWIAGQKQGRIALRTGNGKMTLNFAEFSPDESLWLVRFLRTRLPATIQIEWPKFCHRCALPLRDGQPVREPNVDEVRLTRRRWDWFFGPLIVGATIASAILCLYGWWSGVAYPIFLILSWLLLRCGTPRTGAIAKRMSTIPDVMKFLIFLPCWGAVGLAGVIAMKIFEPVRPSATALGAVAWFSLLLPWAVRLHRFDVERQQREQVDSQKAVTTWDKGEIGAAALD